MYQWHSLRNTDLVCKIYFCEKLLSSFYYTYSRALLLEVGRRKAFIWVKLVSDSVFNNILTLGPTGFGLEENVIIVKWKTKNMKNGLKTKPKWSNIAYFAIVQIALEQQILTIATKFFVQKLLRSSATTHPLFTKTCIFQHNVWF